MEKGLGVEIVAKHPDVVGECPTWDAERRVLLWTDNRSQRIYSYAPSTREIRVEVNGYQAYGFTLQTDGSLLLFLNNTQVSIARNGVVTTLLDGLPGYETTRFNDVLVDPEGRVLCGVLPTETKTGSLQSLDPDGRATVLHEGMELPNGMAFSLDYRTLYVADTRAKKVLAFDYDVAAGSATNARTFLTPGPGEGSPDGITVDAEGSLWVAATGSASVRRYGVDGAQLTAVPLPANKPTSLGFGEDDLDTLFVTSSSREATPGEVLGPEAGALFAFHPRVKGRLEHRTSWRV